MLAAPAELQCWDLQQGWKGQGCTLSWLALSCCPSRHRPLYLQCCASHILVPLALRQVLQQEEARYNSADLNIAYKMSVDEYQRLCPFAEALEENWGKPPGEPSVCRQSAG